MESLSLKSVKRFPNPLDQLLSISYSLFTKDISGFVFGFLYGVGKFWKLMVSVCGVCVCVRETP